MKVEFIDDDSFIIYYFTSNIYENEEEYKQLFQYLNNELIKRYNYYLHGLYDVTIYVNKGIYILEFEYLDDYGRRDFNVTIFLNSDMLYEFEDDELVENNFYYQGKYYSDLANMINDIRLFEYGNIIYGKIVYRILTNKNNY